MYSEWTEAQAQILGVKGPKYKKFGTREEAEEFVRSGGRNASSAGKDGEEKGDGRVAKKAKIEKGGKAVWGKEEVVKVWTDGSSRGNGKVGALAGVGVWFGEGDSRYALSFLFSLIV